MHSFVCVCVDLRFSINYSSVWSSSNALKRGIQYLKSHNCLIRQSNPTGPVNVSMLYHWTKKIVLIFSKINSHWIEAHCRFIHNNTCAIFLRLVSIPDDSEFAIPNSWWPSLCITVLYAYEAKWFIYKSFSIILVLNETTNYSDSNESIVKWINELNRIAFKEWEKYTFLYVLQIYGWDRE